jgi:2-polyprenyl-3-methyl-5-hydroxy-6-metoxy-1,4-benzoquinol methylase
MLSGVASDGSRAAGEYDMMGRAYADDAERNPMNVSYERPQMLAMAGDLAGRRVLDAGCAAGSLSEAMVALGASVVGVDISESLVRIARDRLGSRAEFHVADLAAPLPFLPDGSFDIVTASLVLHYLRNWSSTLQEFKRVLRPDGVLLVSTHHPINDVEIADPPAPYFETTLLTDTWRKGGREFEVRFYHRPLSAIIDALADAGFLVERIPEPIPDRTAFAASPEFYDRMRRAPWFLFIRALKRPSLPSG